ncbi:MAG: hypothetical protein D4R65_00925 [Verrucomicrobiaceae bacterium]|nr:MAG: hypothetical protein D4R65_00925 [Verrucomicrobiaceae bacterium]
MNPPAKLMSRVEGAVMIFALIVILAGTLVLAGWVQMMATATVYPDTTAQGMKNRIAMENARAMARQYMLVSLPGGATLTNVDWVASISNGTWGACSVNGAAGFWTATNQLLGNPFSPFGPFSFVVTNFATLTNSAQSVTWRFLVKSRSPLFAEYPLVVHQTATTNLAWTTPTYKIYYTNVLGFPGFPIVPFTSGTNASGLGTNGYAGYDAAPLGTNYGGNFTSVTTNSITYTNATGGMLLSTNKSGSTYTTNKSGGNLTATLNSTQSESILRYDVPNPLPIKVSFTNTASGNTYINTYTNAAITNLTIVASSSQTNAMHIIIGGNNTSTSNLTLSGTNNTRMIYLNKLSTGTLNLRTATTTNAYSWMFAASLNNSTLNITAPSTSGQRLTLTGGLRSDQNINLSSGNMTLAPATNLIINNELMADRIIWIEDGRNRSP